MTKNSKNWAQEMLNASKSPEEKKEVINACLFVLKTLSENKEPMNSKDLGGLAGGSIGLGKCGWG